jgi:signal transduction histidine kinase
MIRTSSTLDTDADRGIGCALLSYGGNGSPELVGGGSLASEERCSRTGTPVERRGHMDRYVADMRTLLDGPSFGLRLLLADRRGHLRVTYTEGHPIDGGRPQAEARRLTLVDGISRTLEHADGSAVAICPIDRRGEALGVAEVSGSRASIDRCRRELDALIGGISAILRREVDGEIRRRELDLGLAWTAHELRGPLHAVRLTLENAASSYADGTGTTMIRAADELSRLADGLESVLLWAVGGGRVSYRRTDLVGLTQDAIDSCVAETGEDRVVIEGSERLIVSVDALHMRSAIENLIRNALRYSIRGTKVRVTVELRDGEPTIEVENEGPGIPAEDRETIFEPLAIGANGLGTGIGLFVVGRVVGRHGGTIRCYEPEEGRFTFELRLPPSHTPRQDRHRSPDQYGRLDQESLPGLGVR